MTHLKDWNYLSLVGKSFAKLHLFSDKKLEVFGHFWYLTLTRVYFSFRKTTLRYVSPARDLRTSLVIRRLKKILLPEIITVTSDLKIFANSQPSASNFRSFSQSLEQFFLTVGQNNFGKKIPFLVVFSNTAAYNSIVASKRQGSTKWIPLNSLDFSIILI